MRTWLFLLVIASLLPGVIGAVVLFIHEYQDGRAQLQYSTIRTARALVQTVDSQLIKAKGIGQTLSTYGFLESGDLAGFHQKASELLKITDGISNIILTDRSGQQVLNTLLPFGASLPRHANQTQINHVFASGQAIVSNVFIGAVTGRLVISIDLPVLSKDQVVYVLSVVLYPQQLADILFKEHLPSDCVAAIYDRNGTIAARTRTLEEFLGKRGNSVLLQHMQESLEGSFESTSGDGISIQSSYSRSPTSNWSVAIGIPRHSLEAAMMQRIYLLALGSAALFLLSMGLAWFLGGRISRSVRALNVPALALGTGTTVAIAKVHFREADELGQAIERTANLLAQRTQALQQTHALLQERKAELAEAQRIAHLGSWYWDTKTGAEPISTGLRRIFGREEMPPFAEQSGVIYSHKTWKKLNNTAQVTLQTGVGCDLELPAMRGDGSAMWVNIRAEAVRDIHGKLSALRGTVQDITERKRSEAVLLQSQTALRKLAEHQENVRENERKRIARDIHDELGQNLMVLRIDLSAIVAQPDALAANKIRANAALIQVDAIVKSVRAIMNDLRPAVLNLGLHAAIEWQTKEFTRRSGIVCILDVDHEEFPVDDKCATALFRIVQEALTNIMRHAKASQVQITMQHKDGQLILTIVDNGIGVSADAIKKVNAFGLIGTEERIVALDGTFTIESHPEKGMTLIITVPIAMPAAPERFIDPECDYS